MLKYLVNRTATALWAQNAADATPTDRYYAEIGQSRVSVEALTAFHDFLRHRLAGGMQSVNRSSPKLTTLRVTLRQPRWPIRLKVQLGVRHREGSCQGTEVRHAGAGQYRVVNLEGGRLSLPLYWLSGSSAGHLTLARSSRRILFAASCFHLPCVSKAMGVRVDATSSGLGMYAIILCRSCHNACAVPRCR